MTDKKGVEWCRLEGNNWPQLSAGFLHQFISLSLSRGDRFVPSTLDMWSVKRERRGSGSWRQGKVLQAKKKKKMMMMTQMISEIRKLNNGTKKKYISTVSLSSSLRYISTVCPPVKPPSPLTPNIWCAQECIMKCSYISASCKSSVSNVLLLVCYNLLKLDYTHLRPEHALTFWNCFFDTNCLELMRYGEVHDICPTGRFIS